MKVDMPLNKETKQKEVDYQAASSNFVVFKMVKKKKNWKSGGKSTIWTGPL